jgi:hypothetical protein
MKHRNAILIVALAAALLGADAAAQSSAHFKVPFGFTANRQWLPAGDYTVELAGGKLAANSQLTLVDRKTGRIECVLAVTSERGSALEAQGLMFFYVAGKHYYLKEVRLPGTDLLGKLVQSRVMEREMAQKPAPTGSRMEIASK